MKSKFNRFILAGLAAVCIIMTGCGKKSSIVKVDLPSNTEIQQADMHGIAQTDEVNDYVLTDYSVENGKIVYTFTDSVGEKNKISVTGVKMTYEQYIESLPKNGLEETVINGISCSFISRTVHYVPDDYVPDERVKNNVEKGTTEIKYGNPESLDELLPIQRIYWYDEQNSIAYNLEAMGNYYQMADMGIYVSNYMDDSGFAESSK